jgi:Polyketide cyclase / dehydrase and lipid transport
MSATARVRNGAGFAEIVIPRPVEPVFDYVSDLRHMPTWWPTHRTYRRLLGHGGFRTAYAWTMPGSPLTFGLPIAGITVVTAFERPARFSYRIFSPGLFTRMSYGFVGVQGGSRVSLEASPVLSAFAEHTVPALDRLLATLTGPIS